MPWVCVSPPHQSVRVCKGTSCCLSSPDGSTLRPSPGAGCVPVGWMLGVGKGWRRAFGAVSRQHPLSECAWDPKEQQQEGYLLGAGVVTLGLAQGWELSPSSVSLQKS